MNIDFPQSLITVLARIMLAAFLGGLIGFERDIHGRPAGLRTNLLVCAGASLFMVLSVLIPLSLRSGADPTRIAAQIVTGIGFLGAGAIIKEGITVRGLTTAACLWIIAAIGMAAGAGYYAIACLTTLITLGGLMGLNYLERFYPKDSYRKLALILPNSTDVSLVVDIIKSRKLEIIFFDIDRNYETGVTILTLSIRLFQRGITDKLVHSIIKAFEDSQVTVKSFKWDHKL